MATNNITALRNELLTMFDDLRSGKMQPKRAVEVNNTAGKIINSAKVQLEYAKLTKTQPEIAFLKGD